MKQVIRSALLLIIGMLVRAVVFAAAASEDAAKAEGEVVFYSSFNNEQIVPLIEAFKRKYPFINRPFTVQAVNEFCSVRSLKPEPAATRWTS